MAGSEVNDSTLLHVMFGIEPIVPLSARAAQILTGLPMGVSLSVASLDPLKVRHRARLRLSFRQWSQAVDRDGLAGARAWLAAVEDKLNAPH